MTVDRRQVLLLLASASGSAIAGDKAAPAQAAAITGPPSVEGAPMEKAPIVPSREYEMVMARVLPKESNHIVESIEVSRCR